MIRRTLFGGLLLMTVACAPAPAPEPEEFPVIGSGRTCNAAATAGLIGRPASSALGAEALRLSGAGIMRWLRPGEIVTMEFREDRLNIDLDERGRVKRVRCG